MTKAELIEALKDIPEDSLIKILIHPPLTTSIRGEDGYYKEAHVNTSSMISIPDRVIEKKYNDYISENNENVYYIYCKKHDFKSIPAYIHSVVLGNLD